jgi:hypothetical protein
MISFTQLVFFCFILFLLFGDLSKYILILKDFYKKVFTSKDTKEDDTKK